MRENDLEADGGLDLPDDGMLGSVPGFIRGVILNLIAMPIVIGVIFGILKFRGSNVLMYSVESGWSSLLISGGMCLAGSLFSTWFARRSYNRGDGLKLPLFVAFVLCLWVPLIVVSIMFFVQ